VNKAFPQPGAPIQDVIGSCDALLDPGAFSDYGPNGLQVPGPDRIARVVTGVSANADLLEAAAARGADLVLVHHGLFWRGAPLGITPLLHRRLRVLYEHRIALAAYHLPLDAHPEIGNNALLADALALQERGSFAAHGGAPLGVHGTLPQPVAPHELDALVRDAVGGREPLRVGAGPDVVRTVGIVSGAAADDVHEAIALGLDAFVTGEPAERSFSDARDGGIHLLAAGHHATERGGIRALGEHVAARLGIEHEFVDVVNPI
jgi:dinuclear metal center YbgI/SA1388 family protein